MIKIDGYLINGHPKSTRVYDYSDKNLRLTVLSYADQDYIHHCSHIEQAALYTLIWPEIEGQQRRIYIGETSNARKRMI